MISLRNSLPKIFPPGSSIETGMNDYSMTEDIAGETDPKTPQREQRFSLLVDGYARDLFMTGMVLQRLGYNVYIVNTAEDALTLMAAALPALVLTELALPRMSGLELLVRIKKDPKTKTVPVIIHTASDDPSREGLCLASGCASFLKKPVEPDSLYLAIQRATEAAPRQYVRLKTLLPAMVGGRTASSGPQSTEYVSELSENGIFVRTLTPRPLKSVLPVTILIHSIPVKVKAVVLRCLTISRGLFREPGMGMKFVEIASTDRELIRNFIKGQLIKDIPVQ